MKNILYIVIALSLATVSCKNRKSVKQEAQIKVESNLLMSDEKEDMSSEQLKLELDDRQIGVALISISKSVCFGVCPAYSAQIFKDGTLIYEGTKNVENIGKFKGKVDLNALNGAIEEVSNIGFFNLDAVYDNKNVTDLPTTVTYINYKGKTKKVVCRFDCDSRITKVNKVIEVLVKSIKLSRIK